MTKRILAGLAGLALSGAIFGLLPNAQADACDTGENGEPAFQEVPGTGTELYGDEPGSGTDTSGTLGIRGDRGYLEASGSGDSSGAQGHIQGSTYGVPAPVNGRIAGSTDEGITVCLADETVTV